jgi:hypothetical protein
MWLSFPRLVGAISPLVILSACAFGSAGGNHNVIASPALGQTKAASAYDAIRQLRPEILRSRAPGSLMLFTQRQPSVAIDNVIVGGVDVLRGLAASEVSRIEYVNSWKAAKEFGLQLPDGIVLVTKRTGPETAAPLHAAKGSN